MNCQPNAVGNGLSPVPLDLERRDPYDPDVHRVRPRTLYTGSRRRRRM